MRRRKFIGAMAATGLLGATDSSHAVELSSEEGIPSFDRTGVENVIVLIGDGMGFDHMEVTEEIHGRLTLQEFAHTGYNQTDSRSGEVTDSAAAGTALATGFKAYNGQVSVYGDPEGDDFVPLTTQLEAAERVGMATGLVSTTRVTHATPAVYAAHNSNRDNEGEIANQLIASGAEVLLGGGRQEFSNEQLSAAKENGYQILSDADDLESADGDRLLGLFSDSHVPYTLDRTDETPGLLDMTKRAVGRLERDDGGFFLMVEGGRIDHAAHGNDIATTVAETKEFDDVVAYALEYAEANEDTLVVVTSDHETGGLATGNDYGSPIEAEKIANAKASNATIAEEIENGMDVGAAVEEYAHVSLSDDEIEYVDEQRDAGEYGLSNALGEVISDHLGVAWASHKHTGPAQVLQAVGPGQERFLGWNHHVDVSKKILALALFGDRIPPGASTDGSQLHRRVTGDASVREQDVYAALTEYVGPVDDEVSEALDVNGDGLVDYGDVLSLLADDDKSDRGDESERLVSSALD